MINDVDPGYDVCSMPDRPGDDGAARTSATCSTPAGITWGGFMGGFDLDVTNPNGTTGCKRSTHSTDRRQRRGRLHPAPQLVPVLSRRPPTRRMRGRASIAAIGYSYRRRRQTRDPANHEYDLEDFYAAVKAGNFPAVSYIKAPAYQDGHAGYSDPLDEQAGIGRSWSTSCSSSRTGRTPRSSSPGTIPTAGTTTPSRRPTSPSFDAEPTSSTAPASAAPARRCPASPASR